MTSSRRKASFEGDILKDTQGGRMVMAFKEHMPTGACEITSDDMMVEI